MARPFGSIAVAVAAALISAGGVSATVVGCAMSPPADLTPGVDTNLPGLDAAYNPQPGDPGYVDSGAPADDAADSSSEKQPLVPPDAAVDATPPPPVAPKPAAGEVLITEVMYTTAGPEPASEWLELHNLASSARMLAGLILKDASSRTHVIVGPLTIAPNAWVVLARNKAAAIAAKVPAAAIVYEYGTGLADNVGILLANGSTGGISLLNGANVIATAPYGGWFTASGSSVQLKVMDGTQSSAKASWCLSPTVWATGSEKGTPGIACDCP
jgi:Lamin Tail Domain